MILGVDPGTKNTGWGLVAIEGNRYSLVDYGVIRNKDSMSLPEKYFAIYTKINAIIEEYKPDAVSVETQYVAKNVNSAMKLGMARGVVYLCSAKHGISLFEYSPTRAKKAITGNGHADKAQIAHMLKHLLHLKDVISAQDATDALALAITHAHCS